VVLVRGGVWPPVFQPVLLRCRQCRRGLLTNQPARSGLSRHTIAPIADRVIVQVENLAIASQLMPSSSSSNAFARRSARPSHPAQRDQVRPEVRIRKPPIMPPTRSLAATTASHFRLPADRGSRTGAPTHQRDRRQLWFGGCCTQVRQMFWCGLRLRTFRADQGPFRALAPSTRCVPQRSRASWSA
jgi:hypothetical protein